MDFDRESLSPHNVNVLICDKVVSIALINRQRKIFFFFLIHPFYALNKKKNENILFTPAWFFFRWNNHTLYFTVVASEVHTGSYSWPRRHREVFHAYYRNVFGIKLSEAEHVKSLTRTVLNYFPHPVPVCFFFKFLSTDWMRFMRTVPSN